RMHRRRHLQYCSNYRHSGPAINRFLSILMNVFVINSGSSSIKYQLIRMPESEVVCSGLVDRIGLQESTIQHKIYRGGAEEVIKKVLPIQDHATGLQEVSRLLTDSQHGVIRDPKEIE